MATFEACQTVNYSAMGSRCSPQTDVCREYKYFTSMELCAEGDSSAIAKMKLNQLTNGYCAKSGLQDCKLAPYVMVGKTFWSQVADAFAFSAKYSDHGPKW